ncbi:MAG: efflux RND transporter permease subunit [Deltaproteobacteria bacterium]|nr:efflux RND transporter permease subunit [Candidatus Tharpella sp.]
MVKNSINTVCNALFLNLLMVSVVTLLFLRNWCNSLVVVGALPFATLFAAEKRVANRLMVRPCCK